MSWRDAMRLLRPPPKLSPVEWAERHVRIPVGNAIPGPIRFDNAPYQRAPLDLVADPDCTRITLMWGAQVGKTQVMNCAIGYYIGHRPQSQLMMQPTEGDLHTWLDTKLQPLLDSNPELGGLLATPRGRDGVNNKKLKSYPGGFLMFSWAGAPRTMRGRSAPKVYCDEIDGYTVTEEGHPVSLLWQRAATFGDERLQLLTSTPTIKGASAIEQLFVAGDRRRFWLPCPHCESFIVLQWRQVCYEVDADGLPVPESARYACQECGCFISDGEKLAALRRGEWRAERPFRGHASFHLSELYSAFRRWRDIVESYREKLEQNDLQTFVNVSLAETWEETGEQASASTLARRAEVYPAEVPDGGVFLTAGVDMQTDRLEVEVVAWGLGEESWSVDYRVLWGDPLGAEVWEDLDEVLSGTYVHQSGAVLPIAGACLDTGGTAGYTQSAYEYVRERAQRRLFAIKGIGGWGRPIVSSPSKRQSGARTRKVRLFPVGVDEAKLIVMRYLVIAEPGPGYCHFPRDRSPEWFEQLTAERLVTKQVRGFPVREWHMTRDRNEALDCRVYALAALKILNPDLKRQAAKLEDADVTPAASRRDPEPAPEAGTVAAEAPSAEPARRKWKGGRRRRRL